MPSLSKRTLKFLPGLAIVLIIGLTSFFIWKKYQPPKENKCTENCNLSEEKEANSIKERLNRLITLANSQNFALIYDEFYPPSQKASCNELIKSLSKTSTQDEYKLAYLEEAQKNLKINLIWNIKLDIHDIKINQNNADVSRTLTVCHNASCSDPLIINSQIFWTKEEDTWYTSDEYPVCPVRANIKNPLDNNLDFKTASPWAGVEITSRIHCGMFPVYWYSEPISITPFALKNEEFKRTVGSIRKALRKYPVQMLKKNLKTVYLLDHLTSFGVPYGSTYTEDAIFITNSGITDGYDETYIEQEFHHEFSSILLVKNSPDFDKAIQNWNNRQWAAINPVGFAYGSGGYEEIKTGKTGREFIPRLLNIGIINEYAMSSMENDFNEIAINLFKSNPGFWDVVEEYPKIRKKVDLAISFYQNLDASFTEEYFRKISP